MDGLKPSDIPKHPYSIFRRAVERENRLIAKLNKTFITGELSKRERLFAIFFQNENLKENLVNLMRQNVISVGLENRYVH